MPRTAVLWSPAFRLPAFGLVALGGCVDFADVAANVCGNSIIDPGEDCDTFSQGAAECAAPGDGHPCRLICSGPDACPPGWACDGQRGVCIEPSGVFVDAGVVIAEPAIQLATADFDQDQHADVLASGSPTTPIGIDEAPTDLTTPLRVHFFGPGGVVEQSTSLASDTQSFPSIGHLNEDDAPDIALATALGTSVYRARPEERAFSPQAYSLFAVPTDEVVVDPIDIYVPTPLAQLNTRGFDGDEVMVLVKSFTGQNASVIVASALGNEGPEIPPELLLLDGPLSSIAGSVAVGQLLDDPATAPCEEFAIPIVLEDGTAQVTVGTPCTDWLEPGDEVDPTMLLNLGVVPPTNVVLPPGMVAPLSLMLFDLNGDQNLDLVVGGSDFTVVSAPVVRVLVAYGLGDMAFHSTSPPSATPDNTFSDYFPGNTLLSPPLAMGHLNADTWPDFALAAGVYLSIGGAVPIYLRAAAQDGLPREAVIGELNGNGIPDVVFARDNAPAIDFFSGAGGGLFNHFEIATGGPVKDMAVGDFDGDVLADFAMSVDGMVVSPPGAILDSLVVSFGQQGTGPTPVVTLGRPGTITQVTTAYLPGLDEGPADGLAELAVISRAPGQLFLGVAVLFGSPDRQLQSPFGLFERDDGAGEDEFHLSLAVAIAELSATADHPDLAVVTQSETSFNESRTDGHLWLVESTGDAELTESMASLGDALSDEGIVAQESLVSRVDADDDGDDEIVLFAPLYEEKEVHGVFVLADVVDGSLQAVIHEQLDPAFLGRSCPKCSHPTDIAVLANGPIIEGRIEITDIDADGREDVVVLGITYAGESSTSALLVFFNQGGEAASAFDPLEPTVLQLADEPLVSFASIAVDADPAREIVVITPTRALLVEVQDRQLVLGTTVSEVFGTFNALATDVTGDGLEDVLLPGLDGVRLLTQEPVNP